jgi:HTH-type transcriptional regulator / antitoxin HipB
MRIRTAHDIAAVVRGRRLDLGLTQAAVAQRAGVSRKWVSDFETGKTSVDMATLLRLLETLDVRLEAGAGNDTLTPPAGSEPVDLDEVLDRYLRR